MINIFKRKPVAPKPTRSTCTMSAMIAEANSYGNYSIMKVNRGFYYVTLDVAHPEGVTIAIKEKDSSIFSALEKALQKARKVLSIDRSSEEGKIIYRAKEYTISEFRIEMGYDKARDDLIARVDNE